MKVQMNPKLLMLIPFTIVFLICASANAQEPKGPGKNKEQRFEEMAKELNLTENQSKEMKSLKDEHFVEKNRMNDKHKAERKTMREAYDKKLRSILDEKQYYTFKNKMKAGKKHKKMHNRKGQKRGPEENGPEFKD